MHVADQHHQADVGAALGGLRFQALAVEGVEPDAEHEQAHGESEKSLGVEEVEHASGHREQGEGADAAGPALAALRVEFLEGEAEEEAEAQEDGEADR